MAAEKMIRPPPLRGIRTSRLMTIALSIIAAPFLIVGVIALIDDPGTAIICIMPGLLLSLGPYIQLRLLTRRREMFLNSQRTADAIVVDRSKEKPRQRGSGPLLLEVGIAIADRIKPMFEYYLTLEFAASKPGLALAPTKLEAQVSEQIYENHPPGASLRIRYAVDDPRIALPESEYSTFTAEM